MVSKLDRLIIGNKVVDDWIDYLVAAVERSLNVTATGGIHARVGPTGVQLALAIPPPTRIAKASSSGIPARVGSTLGKATDVTLYDLTEGVLTSETINETVYNMSTTAVAANSYVMLTRIGKYLVVNFEDCQA